MLDPSKYTPMDIGIPVFDQQSDSAADLDKNLADNFEAKSNAYVETFRRMGFDDNNATILGGLGMFSELYNDYEDWMYPSYEDKVLHKLDQIRSAAVW